MKYLTYDELRGPDLDAARWAPARLPLPTGGEHIPLDPNAELAVGEGEVRVTISHFSLSHHRFQSADSPKPHLLDSPVRAAAGSALCLLLLCATCGSHHGALRDDRRTS